MARYATYICGGRYDMLDPRSECPNELHDWPLPVDYCDAAEVADARLRARWSNKRCPDCGLYGWRPGVHKPSTRAVRVTPVTDADEEG